MYEQFGAVVSPDNKKVEFKLFFPDNSIDPKQSCFLFTVRAIRSNVSTTSNRFGGWRFHVALPILTRPDKK